MIKQAGNSKLSKDCSEYIAKLITRGHTRDEIVQFMKKKYKRGVSYETIRRIAREYKLAFKTSGQLSSDKTAFVDKLIAENLPQFTIRELFLKKFKESISKDSVRRRAAKVGHKFVVYRDNLYSKDEEATIKGGLLNKMNCTQIKKELPNRSLQAVRLKVKNMMANGAMSDIIKTSIISDIKSNKNDTHVAAKYGIDPKHISKFRNGFVKTSEVEVKDLKRWENADVNEVLDLIEQAQEKLLGIDSEQGQADIKISTNSKYVALTFISDIHLENVNTDIRQLRTDIATITATPDFYVGFGGDLIDNFMVGPHKEGIVEAVVPPRAARIAAGKLFDALKGRLLWSILGCHDAWDANYADYNLPEHIARKLGVPYLGHGGDINLTLQKRGAKKETKYKLHARHKYKGGSSNNGTATCKKVLTEIGSDFDIVAISHNHFAEIKLEHYLGKQRCFIRTGSYKREDRFSKSLGYQANEFNTMIPVVILNTQTRQMKVVSGIENASELLKALNK